MLRFAYTVYALSMVLWFLIQRLGIVARVIASDGAGTSAFWRKRKKAGLQTIPIGWNETSQNSL